ncbi:MAG: DUF3181 family protein [Jaaginema sp. PMC 1079.18]|nr:DUF3181 family protein [Jaaginema sp. PMC 1080.18]MEC4849638.1 DUF3181 family protein [Jaaginema sp. PMC 1079.18]MEC4864682.1 DUF3181 family protein [Jaaginema sp. PMC 1078.18]
MASTNENLEALAAEIGENIYIDVAKWHLYLAEAHLHTVVAEKMYPLLLDGNLTEDAMMQELETINVKLGGGKVELSLAKLLPQAGLQDLLDLLEQWRDRF